MATTDPASKFNLKNLRQGGEFNEGDGKPAERGKGWDGALHGLTRANRPQEYQNLSRQDVAKGAAVLEEKLKSKDNYGGGLDRQDIKDVNIKYEQMRRAGELSAADAKDFKNIAGNLKQGPAASNGKPPVKSTPWW